MVVHFVGIVDHHCFVLSILENSCQLNNAVVLITNLFINLGAVMIACSSQIYSST